MTDSQPIELTGQSFDQSSLTQIAKLLAGIVNFNLNLTLNCTPKQIERFTFTPQQVGELLTALEQVGEPPASVGSLVESQPPKPLRHWQGRAAELQQLQRWLLAERRAAVGIVGIGGVGKSSLAAKLLAEPKIAAAYPQCFWADVGTGATFASLARQVLAAFGAAVPEEEQNLGGALLNCLRERPRLLVLDNLESLLRAEDRGFASPFYDDFVRRWLEYGDQSALLVTTRERPELREFNCWQELAGLAATEGAALLADYGIGGDLLGFAARADGHPLLLTLVANLLLDEYPDEPHLDRLADLGLAGLWDWLDKVKGQHRTETVAVAAVLAASVARLSEVQRQLFLQASVYRGEFAAEAAAALLPDMEVATVGQELRRLARRSLLVERSEGGRRWFGFQPLVLEYARYVAGDLSAAHRRAIEFYRQQARPRRAWQTLADVQDYLEMFHHYCELADWSAAFYAIRHDMASNDVDEFLSLRGYYQTAVTLYTRLVEHWPAATQKTDWRYGACLTSLGLAYDALGQYQRALEFHQQHHDIAREIGDRRGEASSLGNLGNAYHSLGQYQRAIDFYQQSLEIKREIGDRRGEANSLGGLGIAYDALGQYQRALEFHQQHHDIAREIGDRQGEANSLNNLGIAYDALGQYQRALEFHQQHHDIAREIGDRRGEASSLGGLGNAYNSLGQSQRALEFHQQSLEIKREIGDRQGEANSLGGLGNAYYSLGQYQRALEFHQQWLDIAREIGDRRGEASSLFNMGIVLAECDRRVEARQSYSDARDLFQELGIEHYVETCQQAIQRLNI